jgi:hypothetical protein
MDTGAALWNGLPEYEDRIQEIGDRRKEKGLQ